MPKLLIPKGRDRDKLIALKKEKYAKLDAIKVKDAIHTWMVIDCKYWSTDRNEAWELWDELPNPKTLVQGEKGEYLLVNGYVCAEGTSFADAVSKAWLQWWYNTQWGKR